MSTFPRNSNNYCDDGKIIGVISDCPNCKSQTGYKQTISTESCSDCGLFFDYWGNGGNQIYNDMLLRKAQKEEWEEYQQKLDEAYKEIEEYYDEY